MTKLLAFQQQFLQDILQQKDIPVYKNNTRLILRDIITGIFPVTAILMGDEFIEYAALEFMKAFPPDCGDMNLYGGRFPDFIEQMPGLQNHPYVPDVARLEWLAHVSYIMPRMPVITADDLAKVSDPVNLQLPVQSHVFLLRSGWPVDTLWSDIRRQGAETENLVIQPQETFIAVYREEKSIAVWPLDEGAYIFIENLQLDPTFAFAAQAALRADKGLPLDRMLAQFVRAEFFEKI